MFIFLIVSLTVSVWVKIIAFVSMLSLVWLEHFSSLFAEILLITSFILEIRKKYLNYVSIYFWIFEPSGEDE